MCEQAVKGTAPVLYGTVYGTVPFNYIFSFTVSPVLERRHGSFDE
jgi:hypothetical protein